ncbi:hypothetical protein Mmc1_0955 [Magnetococcus marinus MC-1]|uniref:Uncharacterized protein n=1 Tax=Magnetococcus marinus (strain ATCC BAA-1437 / JCM 17883 / MC-1) TaxID=156889 RepID=A0L680_MAGMM|nr:hypothetical protein [Magnetococcus marinus]ABK43473.1 hypothetical protein Mmc1_0955 [Magnetococcus marinus MC-1]
MKSNNSSLSKSSLSRGGAGLARLRASYDSNGAEPSSAAPARRSLSRDEAPPSRREPSMEPRSRRPSSRTAGVQGQDHGYRPASVEGLRQQIQEISTRAKDERLECAIPLLESLRMALALDRAAHNTPPGTLTVKGWSSLLSNWEAHIQKSRSRQMVYTKSFFAELAEDGDLKNSPLEPIFQQLVMQIQTTLTQKGMAAA